jgi:hypothetical protein
VGLEPGLSTHRNKEVDEKWGNKTSKKALHQSSSKIGSSNKARIKPEALSSEHSHYQVSKAKDS